MNVRFSLDPETGESHIYYHGITVVEVYDVLARPGEDHPGREGARDALGRADTAGRLRPGS